MRLLQTILGKIKEAYYKHAAWFCKRRADNAFNEQDVSYVRWEQLVSEYCNKYIVIRESLG